ncbi:MAG: DNA gyrase subunit A [Planctomycetota bacterium]|nr:MAG: DNA gyrase subunit A [Planctomycetota bacterium]
MPIKELMIQDEMKDSYLAYAMSVIVSRALPDVRDGLKPSQRRILVAMNDLNLGPNAKYRKCAKVVGDTSGNYHPHGDGAIYPTLVRLAQDFNMRYELVQGQGNFGSIDGDPPAAMRYTECRLTHASALLLEDLKYDTVEFVPNYDDTRKEPTILPGAFPNLLANGASGIAVGMATSIPSHNIREVADAIIAVIDDPEISIPQLLTILRGPDFPTGGIICGTSGLQKAYLTGRGILTLRARAHIEEPQNHIVITEIPYQITKNKIIEKIVEQVKLNKLKGVADIRDESDRQGMRLVIIPKRGEDPNVLLNQLYKHTQLQTSFSIIMIALKNGRPYTFNLKELIEAYIEHRFEVITRKTRYLLRQAQAQAHQLEGLLLAYDFVDRIIQIIRASSTPDEAKDALVQMFGEREVMKHFLEHRYPRIRELARQRLEASALSPSSSLLSSLQAEMILKMRLSALTGLEQKKLDTQYANVVEELENYQRILGDRNEIYSIIKSQLEELKKRFGDARRTTIEVGENGDLDMEDLIPDELWAITISQEGYIKRVPLSTYKSQGRGGKGIVGSQTKDGDVVKEISVASSHNYLLFFTSHGNLHCRKVWQIPEASRTSKGRAIVNLLQLEEGEKITSQLSISQFEEGKYIFMATARGTVKKTCLSDFTYAVRKKIRALHLEEGDTLVKALLTDGQKEILLATAKGKAIRFSENQVRSMGRGARGVRGIRLGEGDCVRAMVEVQPGGTLLTVCENGYGKRTPFEQYRLTSRGGQGVANLSNLARTGEVIGAHSVRSEDELILVTRKGKVIRLLVKDIRLCGRATQGVILIKMMAGDKLASSASISAHLLEEEKGPQDALPQVCSEGEVSLNS